MKTALLASLAFAAISLQAQVGTSPRTLVKPIEPLTRPQPPRYGSTPQPAPAPGAAAAPVNHAPLGPKELEAKKAEQSVEEKKKLQWQTERAEKGSDSAQFTLGLRYFTADGVEKDPAKAMKWLAASAKQGNTGAKKKLAEWKETKPDEFAKAEADLKQPGETAAKKD